MTPVQLGSNFFSASSVSGDRQIIAPSANTNGIIIRTATFHIGDDYAILATGLKAPAAFFVDTPVILSGRGVKGTSSGFQGNGFVLQYPIVIPAGYGLWFSKSGSDSSAGVFVTYDLVPAA
jgi:hypothetical protein